ncbi:MAG: hypothetical protein Q4E22_05485 [Coriobacteriia bacterium]|nr:hypothetical protein [Coriobacteriia bacterium]
MIFNQAKIKQFFEPVVILLKVIAVILVFTLFLYVLAFFVYGLTD